MSNQEPLEDESPVGGVSFYLSLCALLLLSAISSASLPTVIGRASSHVQWLYFVGGMVTGALIARFLIRGRLSVLLHEIKHSLVSNLVGNRWKALEVESETGSFRYAYSKHTARFNAFIALAPYWLPIFTALALLTGYAALYRQFRWVIALTGLGFGIDLVLNVRDISPIQSDITNIRGGYAVGLLYIVAINLFVITLLASWVAGGGLEGLRTLGTSSLKTLEWVNRRF